MRNMAAAPDNRLLMDWEERRPASARRPRRNRPIVEPATRAAAILLLCTLLVFHNLQLQPELVSEALAFVTAAIAYGLVN